MKRIGHLFERVVDPDNLRLAFWKASRGKRFRDDQRRYQRILDEEIIRLRDGLLSGDYPLGKFKRFTIYDPKEREICAVPFGERVLHHALMNVCEPYFDKWLIHDSYACRKGKGQVAAVKRARLFAHRHEWFMKCDFRKYFDSVPHDRLKAALERRFKDPFVLGWFIRIIDSYEKTAGKGLPIGSLTSQHFANIYLDPLDRFVAVAERPPYRMEGSNRIPYVRYMDDFVFWSDDKDSLLSLRRAVVDFVRGTLGLELKQEPFVNRTRYGMDFLGMRVFPNTISLGRASRERYRRKLKAYVIAFERGEWGETEYQAHLTALTAFTEQADARAWRRKILADCEELRARTECCAAAVGTTTRGTAVPRTATGTTRITATTTTASASVAPQHRRTNRAVPAVGPFAPQGATNDNRRIGASSEAERSDAPPFSNGKWKSEWKMENGK